jgi:hypothetical protein
MNALPDPIRLVVARHTSTYRLHDQSVKTSAALKVRRLALDLHAVLSLGRCYISTPSLLSRRLVMDWHTTRDRRMKNRVACSNRILRASAQWLNPECDV